MKVAAVVLTHNVVDNGRAAMFDETVRSLGEADWVYAIDNGSSDATADWLRAQNLDGVHTNDSGVTTSGHGTMLGLRVGAATDADVVVLSDDDMVWRPGWRSKLVAWWDRAPVNVALTGCHLEPEFLWNAIVETVVFGGVAGLVRASTGAASWSFRRADYLLGFAPVVRMLPTDQQGLYDVPFCRALWERHWKVAQIDLADHAGHGRSTWGNQTVDLYGWDVDPVRKRLEGVR